MKVMIMHNNKILNNYSYIEVSKRFDFAIDCKEIEETDSKITPDSKIAIVAGNGVSLKEIDYTRLPSLPFPPPPVIVMIVIIVVIVVIVMMLILI